MQYPGKIIVIEGMDGAGKATQAKMLIDRCLEEGLETATFDFPQYELSTFGEMVGAYLRGEFGEATELSPYLVSLLYAGDRFEAKSAIIRALENHRLIILNRYTTANSGFQRGKFPTLEERRLYQRWLVHVEHEIFGIPREDLVIYLDVPPEEGQRLVQTKDFRGYIGSEKVDQHEKNIQFLNKAYLSFQEMINENPHWQKISCLQYGSTGPIRSREDIHKDVWLLVSDFIKSYPELKARW